MSAARTGGGEELNETVVTMLWLLFGLILVAPLLYFADAKNLDDASRLLGKSLVVAAFVYVLFAVAWGGDKYWLAIEALGIAVYGLFYWLSLRGSPLWLAVGWLAHPVWDVPLHLLGPGSHIVPEWYAVACVSFDAAVALYIICRVKRASTKNA